MSGYYINVHIKSTDAVAVLSALADIFADYGFAKIGDEAAGAAVEADLLAHEERGCYGVIVSPPTHDGWSAVYVDDWQDSGVIASGLSRILETQVLEIWVADEVNWGYAYFENGAVLDRFADDPSKVTDKADEISALAGKPDALAPVLGIPPADFRQVLSNARATSGQFVGPAIDDLANAVSIPFEHILIGYDSFFDDDPEDYIPGLIDWPHWRHFTFKNPDGRDRLAD